jgi:hypothetical protein
MCHASGLPDFFHRSTLVRTNSENNRLGQGHSGPIGAHKARSSPDRLMHRCSCRSFLAEVVEPSKKPATQNTLALLLSRCDHCLYSFRATAGAVSPICSAGSRCDPVFTIAWVRVSLTRVFAHLGVDPDSLAGTASTPRLYV